MTTGRRSTSGDVVALVAPLAVGALGSVPTLRSIPTWYRALRKPPWNPPDRVFGPVWTTLYLLMGLAALLIRRADRLAGAADVGTESGPAAPVAVDRAQRIWALQLVLNLAWSFVFFGRRSVRGGLAVIVALWASIVATIAAFWPIRRVAALLLVPYLAWVSFASLLNAEIARRNDR